MKKKNRCYSARYGARYGRNFQAPRKKAGESWVAYHDRLSALAAEARKRGAPTAAKALERKAAAVANKHLSVRRTPRRGKRSGPGTYPWSQCIKDARARGARDPAAVCGAIRARSRKRYPTYWAAKKKKNSSARTHREAGLVAMNAAVFSLKEGLSAASEKKRVEWLLSANMWAGYAVAEAVGTSDKTMIKESVALEKVIRTISLEQLRTTARKTKNTKKKNAKKATKKKASPRKRNKSAAMRSFMRL